MNAISDVNSDEFESYNKLISLLSRKLRQIESERQVAKKDYLSPGKLNLLAQINRLNPITLKELSASEKVALPTLSKLVDELQKHALVIRAQAKNDARKKWIVPTQKGLKILHESNQENQLFWQQKLETLSKTEIQNLTQSISLLLTKL